MIDIEKYQWLKIQPVDAWFFRDGRPSNRGEDQSDLRSEFPPNAATLVGALRASLARQQGWNGQGSWGRELTAVLGDGFDELGSLSFLGPLLMQENTLLFPMPRHVVGYSSEHGFQPLALMTPSRERVATDLGEVHLPELPDGWRERMKTSPGLSDAQREKRPESDEGLFVTVAGMDRILSGLAPQAADCRRPSELFTHESRVGIRRDEDSRTTGQGEIYSPRYVRLHPDVSLVMAVTGVPEDWTIPSLMPLGGESRLAGIEPLNPPPLLPKSSSPRAPTALISVTPARFLDPWWGAGPDDSAVSLSAGLSGRILTVALDRPRHIGGWDFRSGPRPLVPFVPAGTVWWLEEGKAEGSGIIQIGDPFHTQYGHGMALISGTPDR